MIKELISELIENDITLSQGLTKAKLISLELKNDLFQKWLEKELKGYEYDDSFLPNYRKIQSPISLIGSLPAGKQINFHINIPDEIEDDHREFLEVHKILEPISLIELQIQNIQGDLGEVNLPEPILNILKNLLSKQEKLQIQIYKARITKGYREINKLHLNNILEQTKQNLIDTLSDFAKEFPDKIENFNSNTETEKKVQNIVNNHIYGNNNPMNLAMGVNVGQSGNYINLTTSEKIELEKLGVEKEQIEQLTELINEKEIDKNSKDRKIMSWLGSVSASIAAKGLYENIPVLNETIQNLIFG